MSSLRRRLRPAAAALAGVGLELGARALRPALSVRAGPVDAVGHAVVVAPHPDDEVAGCGGSILGHVARGDRVTVLLITDGRASRALDLAPDAMARVRAEEARRAAERLGVELVAFGLPELEWSLDALVGPLARALQERRAPVVYAPCRIDGHPEHVRVACALALALERGAASGYAPELRAFPLTVPLTPLLTNRVHEVSEHEAQLVSAYSAHASQVRTTLRTLRMRRLTAAAHGGQRLAEALWVMEAAAYVARHHPAALLEHTLLRGVGDDALDDPAAYLRGGASRWRARRAG